MSYESIRFGQNLRNKHKEGNLILKRCFYMSKSPVYKAESIGFLIILDSNEPNHIKKQF